MIVSALMIHSHHKHEYKSILKNEAKGHHKLKTQVEENTFQYQEYAVVESISNSNVQTTEMLTLKRISSGFVEVNTNEFYASRDVRELTSSRAIVNGVQATIIN